MKKIIFSIGFLIFLIPASSLFAMDTDLYVISSTDVAPNVLIMFDNSGSMNESVSGAIYDPAVTYPFIVTESPGAVYYRTTGGSWNVYRSSIADVQCSTVQTALNNEGFYTGRIQFASSQCGSSNRVNLQTGNYMNYMQMTGGPADRPKLGLAKGIIQSFINTTDGVRFGAMIFNPDINNNSEGGHILKEVKDMTPQNQSDLHAAIGGLSADTWTPLAETLYEAGLYYKGAASYFNPGVHYTSPIQYYCQKSYVIIITDGESTKDQNAVLKTIGNQGDVDGDQREPGLANAVPYEDNGSDYLDDVANYLHQSDLSPLINQQNIVTYTIGFTVDSPLLARTAEWGGGKYFYAHNAQSFIAAFQSIIDDILSKSTSYIAPVVPISQMERTSAGNRMYLAMFKPTRTGFWQGNLKKYGIVTENSGTLKVGDIIDVSNTPVMDGDNKIKESAKSYWSSVPDGGEVEKGGVGEALLKRTTARKIYTYLGTNTDLTDASNAFGLSNSQITPTKLGLNLNDDAGRDKLINFMHGYDAYDENGNLVTIEKRDWILGAFIHSRPLIIHYENRSVVFGGANDGMLHAFDDATGEELWAFIPPTLLPNLKNLTGESLAFSVDGAPKAYIDDNKKVIVFGLRRGGNQYVALDITDPLTPQWLWDITPSTSGYSELGQTWSTPQIGKIQHGGSEKWVAFIGGGYDVNQDNDPVSANDTKGRAVYVVDILTGSLVWSYSYANNAEMKYSIPSDIARVDTDGNGKIDRFYVGDTGGRIWRFDIGNSDTSQWTVKNIFNSNPGVSDKRKVFYPPDVSLEKDSSGNYEMLYFGTGDREHPKNVTRINRLYAVKDKNPSGTLTETDLVDVTGGTYDAATLSLLDQKQGWYIKLDTNAGEKALATPVVFFGVAYYTTFTPSPESLTDICFLGEGTSRLYALRYTTGAAVFNLDGSLDGVISQSDRSTVIGTAVPSGVVITFIQGTATGYVGVGGGVYSPGLPKTKSLVPVSWRIVF
jgi:type IV pilus assembly protein PilY1